MQKVLFTFYRGIVIADCWRPVCIFKLDLYRFIYDQFTEVDWPAVYKPRHIRRTSDIKRMPYIRLIIRSTTHKSLHVDSASQPSVQIYLTKTS